MSLRHAGYRVIYRQTHFSPIQIWLFFSLFSNSIFYLFLINFFSLSFTFFIRRWTFHSSLLFLNKTHTRQNIFSLFTLISDCLDLIRWVNSLLWCREWRKTLIWKIYARALIRQCFGIFQGLIAQFQGWASIIFYSFEVIEWRKNARVRHSEVIWHLFSIFWTKIIKCCQFLHVKSNFLVVFWIWKVNFCNFLKQNWVKKFFTTCYVFKKSLNDRVSYPAFNKLYLFRI